MEVPLLSDLETTKTKYHDGDRIVVRLSQSLSPDQRRVLERSINRYTRACVNVLFVDCRNTEVTIRRSNGTIEVLAGKIHLSTEQQNIFLLSCTKVNANSGDIFFCRSKIYKNGDLNQFFHRLRRWAGDFEVVTNLE